ncbi:MAG: PASTA domain-containing protein [Dysgonamonadaceae bacterium]|jgi:beta-lactam-binding protein with PASTA domain|nr:PASTA domain-containing protein [Dysgonamonadaceae bacterium]
MNRNLKLGIFNLLGFGLAIIALVIGAYVFTNVYTQHGDEVEIPDVKGLTVSRAEPLFAAKGLECVVTDSIFSKTDKPGTILETVPPQGSKVKKGRTVQLKITSFTARMIEVPEIHDTSERHAMATLRSYGFEQISVKSVPGVYRDLVIGLECKGKPVVAGEKLPSNAPLSILVSSGDGMTFSDDSASVVPLDSPEENWF